MTCIVSAGVAFPFRTQIVSFDEDDVGTMHRGDSKTLPPTVGGFGSDVLEKSIGSSSGGFRPVEDEVDELIGLEDEDN